MQSLTPVSRLARGDGGEDAGGGGVKGWVGEGVELFVFFLKLGGGGGGSN